MTRRPLNRGLKVLILVIGLVVCHGAIGGYYTLRFRPSKMVGLTVQQVLDEYGEPRESCWLEPEAGQTSPRRVFGPQAIEILKSGGDGDLMYVRYLQRFGVHIRHGVVTGVEDATH